MVVGHEKTPLWSMVVPYEPRQKEEQWKRRILSEERSVWLRHMSGGQAGRGATSPGDLYNPPWAREGDDQSQGLSARGVPPTPPPSEQSPSRQSGGEHASISGSKGSKGSRGSKGSKASRGSRSSRKSRASAQGSANAEDALPIVAGLQPQAENQASGADAKPEETPWWSVVQGKVPPVRDSAKSKGVYNPRQMAHQAKLAAMAEAAEGVRGPMPLRKDAVPQSPKPATPQAVALPTPPPVTEGAPGKSPGRHVRLKT